jgi:hypothetical protein
VPRNDFCARWNFAEHFLDADDKALHGTAAANKWKHPREKHVPHVHYVRLFEIHHDIGVGVSVGEMENSDVLAVLV